MIANQHVEQRTRNFARVLGPFYAMVGIVVATRAADMRYLLAEFTNSAVWPWVTGAFILMGGIAIVAFHQYWRGAAAIIVSAIGWAMTAKGFFLLAFPHAYSTLANRVIGATPVWQGVYLLAALMGVYLAYVGWVAVPDQRATQSPADPRDLPRAA